MDGHLVHMQDGKQGSTDVTPAKALEKDGSSDAAPAKPAVTAVKSKTA